MLAPRCAARRHITPSVRFYARVGLDPLRHRCGRRAGCRAASINHHHSMQASAFMRTLANHKLCPHHPRVAHSRRIVRPTDSQARAQRDAKPGLHSGPAGDTTSHRCWGFRDAAGRRRTPGPTQQNPTNTTSHGRAALLRGAHHATVGARGLRRRPGDAGGLPRGRRARRLGRRVIGEGLLRKEGLMQTASSNRGVPKQALARAWALADANRDARGLRFEEFCVFMHLLAVVSAGGELPRSLPSDLAPPPRSRRRLPATRHWGSLQRSFDDEQRPTLQRSDAAGTTTDAPARRVWSLAPAQLRSLLLSQGGVLEIGRVLYACDEALENERWRAGGAGFSAQHLLENEGAWSSEDGSLVGPDRDAIAPPRDATVWSLEAPWHAHVDVRSGATDRGAGLIVGACPMALKRRRGRRGRPSPAPSLEEGGGSGSIRGIWRLHALRCMRHGSRRPPSGRRPRFTAFTGRLAERPGRGPAAVEPREDDGSRRTIRRPFAGAGRKLRGARRRSTPSCATSASTRRPRRRTTCARRASKGFWPTPSAC